MRQAGEFQRVGGEKTLRVTVRVISATSQDLPALVSQKKFREAKAAWRTLHKFSLALMALSVAALLFI